VRDAICKALIDNWLILFNYYITTYLPLYILFLLPLYLRQSDSFLGLVLSLLVGIGNQAFLIRL